MPSEVRRPRVLVAGWFSFLEVIATVGDELGADAVCGWLREAAVDHDVAWAPYFRRGVDMDTVDPSGYTHLVFVSGPVMPNELLDRMLRRFASCTRWAVNVSLVDPTMRGRFDAVWERDGSGSVMPDLAMAAPAAPGPVLAVAYSPTQSEYGPRAHHVEVHHQIDRWISQRGLAAFTVDMDLWTSAGERRPRQVQQALARADVVISMRLHALVLGLQANRPVIACDPIAGGAKVSAQAAALQWPAVVAAEQIGPVELDRALAVCTAAGTADTVTTSRRLGLAGVDGVRSALLTALLP